MGRKHAPKTVLTLKIDFIDRYGNNSGWMKKIYSLVDSECNTVIQDCLMCNITFYADANRIKIVKK